MLDCTQFVDTPSMKYLSTLALHGPCTQQIGWLKLMQKPLKIMKIKLLSKERHFD
jgi:hypothetical protein